MAHRNHTKRYRVMETRKILPIRDRQLYDEFLEMLHRLHPLGKDEAFLAGTYPHVAFTLALRAGRERSEEEVLQTVHEAFRGQLREGEVTGPAERFKSVADEAVGLWRRHLAQCVSRIENLPVKGKAGSAKRTVRKSLPSIKDGQAVDEGGYLYLSKQQIMDLLQIAGRAIKSFNYADRPFDYQERAAANRDASNLLHDAFDVLSPFNSDQEVHRVYSKVVDGWWKTLYNTCPPGFWRDFKRLRRGNRSALETAIAFLEADPWFHRSGYIKEYLIRFINRLDLSPEHQDRLRRVVISAVESRDRREFRRYCRLARRVCNDDLKTGLRSRLDHEDPGVRRRAGWVLTACGDV